MSSKNEDIRDTCFRHATVGLIIIGDDILKGAVADENSSFAATLMYKNGVELKKITIICDDVDKISNEVHIFSQKYDYVITSGGIGVNFDDVTYEGVAKAFNEPLEKNPKLCEKIPITKKANVPKSSKINTVYCNHRRVYLPFVCFKNVYILPGNPDLFKLMFESALSTFELLTRFYTKEIYFKVFKEKFTETLSILIKEHPNVKFSSSTVLENPNYFAKITMESKDLKDVELVYEKLLSSFSEEYLVKLGKQN